MAVCGDLSLEQSVYKCKTDKEMNECNRISDW